MRGLTALTLFHQLVIVAIVVALCWPLIRSLNITTDTLLHPSLPAIDRHR